MTLVTDFLKMTDEEIQNAFRKLAINCQYSNDPKVVFQDRVEKDFNCSYTVAITFSKPNSAGQRMCMGMVYSPTTGKIINF